MPMSALEVANFNPSSVPRKFVRSRTGIVTKMVTLYNDWTGDEVNINIEKQMGGGECETEEERENNIILREMKNKGFLPYPPANPRPAEMPMSKEVMKNMQDGEKTRRIMEAVKEITEEYEKIEAKKLAGKAVKKEG